MESTEQAYWVYVLWSGKVQKRYIGSSDNPEERLREHNSGQSSFTRGGRPWILIHKEPHRTKTEALQRERFLKSGAGRKWLDEHFQQYRRSGTSK
jgi:putative endonuclease